MSFPAVEMYIYAYARLALISSHLVSNRVEHYRHSSHLESSILDVHP